MPAPNPDILWWKGQGSSGAFVPDLSGNGNNGALTAGTFKTSPVTNRGRVGKAFYFDGASRVSAPHSASLDIPTGGTVSMAAWVYVVYEPTDPSNWYTIVSKRDNSLTSPHAYGMVFGDTDSGEKVLVYSSGASGIQEFAYHLPYKEWVHVVGIIRADGPTELWVNGKLIGTAGSGGGVLSNTADVQIGRLTGAAEFTDNFKGFVDDIRIYSTRLTAAQIAAIYREGVALAPDIAWYKLDAPPYSEAQGNLTKDDSGNGRHGTAIGSYIPFNGNIGGAVYFGAGGYINCGPIPDISFASFSVAAWFSPGMAQIGPGMQSQVFSKGYASDRTVSQLGITDGKIFFGNYFGSGGTPSLALDPTVITTPGWYHAVGTCDGVNWRLYVNGVLVNTTPVATVGIENGADWTIGNILINGSSSQGFTGLVSEARIYSGVLTLQNVTDLYQLGMSLVPDRLWLKFDEGVPELTDHSQNNAASIDGYRPSYVGPTPLVGEPGASFDGVNDYCTVPNIFYFPTGDQGTTDTIPISFSIWFKTSTGGTILGQQNSSANDPTGFVPMMYVGGDGKLHGTFGWKGAVDRQLVSTTTVNNNQWHHACITYAAGGVEKLYINGVLEATQTQSLVNYTNVYFYYLGRGRSDSWPNSISQFFNGSMRDFRVYARSLNLSEVQAVHLGDGPESTPRFRRLGFGGGFYRHSGGFSG